MTTRDDPIEIDHQQVKDLVEREDIASILRNIDYRLWEEQEAVAVELAEETFGYLAAVHDLDVHRDLKGITMYVEQELDYLAEAVPDSYFDTLHDGEEHTGYRINGDNCYVKLHFGQTHGGDRVRITTFYDYLQIYIPTVDAYIAYSKEHGVLDV